jgi:hypothetical protein
MNLSQMFAILFLWLPYTGYDYAEKLSPMPPPTKEIAALIEQLDDDSYHTRQAAHDKLVKMGWPALKGVKDTIKKPKSPEQRVRCERIYAAYFNVWPKAKDEQMPIIWMMPEKKRFLGKKFKIERLSPNPSDPPCSLCKVQDVPDMSRWYYERAIYEYNLYAKRNKYEEMTCDNNWRDTEIARTATQLYLKDMLLMGVPREKVQRTVDHMVDNSKKFSNYYLTAGAEGSYSYDWNDLPPGPLVKNEEFKDPNSYGPR